jgi:hypothetical protein
MNNVIKVSNFMTQTINLKGCKIASITTRTSVAVPKYYMIGGEVTKVTTKGVLVNLDYVKATNNRLKKEGKEPTFKAKPLPWGEWLAPKKIITHNGKCYLRMYEFKGAKHKTMYFVNGQPANECQLTAIKEYENSKHKPSNTQGLTRENEVRHTNVAEENILAFKCGEIQYNKREVISVSVAM